MPELPDVEAFREVLDRCARGRRIARVTVRDAGVLHGVSAAGLRSAVTGRRFAAPERRGKWLLAPTDGPTVVFHFGMTGRLVCAADGEPGHPHDRVVFALDGHRLRYRDQRKLKGLWLARDAAAVDRLLGDQGPDALTVDQAAFDALLTGRRARVKSVLTDQSALAGLGNLLADEILWRARLAPGTPAGALDGRQRRRLHGEMRRVLREAVREGRVPPHGDWLTGHRRGAGERCPRCGTALERGRVAGRGTVWCPSCQPVDG